MIRIVISDSRCTQKAMLYAFHLVITIDKTMQRIIVPKLNSALEYARLPFFPGGGGGEV